MTKLEHRIEFRAPDDIWDWYQTLPKMSRSGIIIQILRDAMISLKEKQDVVNRLSLVENQIEKLQGHRNYADEEYRNRRIIRHSGQVYRNQNGVIDGDVDDLPNLATNFQTMGYSEEDARALAGLVVQYGGMYRTMEEIIAHHNHKMQLIGEMKQLDREISSTIKLRAN